MLLEMMRFQLVSSLGTYLRYFALCSEHISLQILIAQSRVSRRQCAVPERLPLLETRILATALAAKTLLVPDPRYFPSFDMGPGAPGRQHLAPVWAGRSAFWRLQRLLPIEQLPTPSLT